MRYNTIDFRKNEKIPYKSVAFAYLQANLVTQSGRRCKRRILIFKAVRGCKLAWRVCNTAKFAHWL